MVKTCPFNLKSANYRILWEITSKCNLKCKHCMYYDNNVTQKRDLDFDEIKSIIDQIANEGMVKEIWLSGGEPLVRKDIIDIVKYINDKKMIPSISSNGTLITKGIAKDLFDNGIRYVHVSIDGDNEKTHDTLRGVDGAFNKTIEGVNNLIQTGIMVGASFMVTEDSINQVPNMIKIAEELKLSIMSFYLVEPLGRATESDFGNRVELAKKLKKIKIENENSNEEYCNRMEFLRLDENVNDNLEICYGEKFLTITADGHLGVCPWLMKSRGKYESGAILDIGFKKAWIECQNYIKYIKNKRRENRSCSCCDEIERCGLGCPAISIYDEFNPYGFDYLCKRNNSII